jgi:hypothetical protein
MASRCCRYLFGASKRMQGRPLSSPGSRFRLPASGFWLLSVVLWLLPAGFMVPASSGMDTFSTPWIANLTEQSVEFSLTDSRSVGGSFQLRPGTILQYSVGPQEIVTLSVTRASGKADFYDQASLQRLRLQGGAPKDYLLILPDTVQFVSKQEFKARLSGFKRLKTTS